MKNIFIIIFVVLAMIMAACCIIAEKKKSEYSKPIIWLIIAAIATTYSYTTFLMSGNIRLATFLEGMYFIFTDWMLFALLDYAVWYTNRTLKSKIPKFIIVALAGIDSVSILLNNFTHHVFTLHKADYPKTGITYWSPVFENTYFFHLGFCYIMIFFSVMLLSAKLVSSPKLYRFKYMLVLIQVMAMNVINALCFGLDLPIDYSILFYAVTVISLFYFSLYAVPNGLVENILSYVVEEVNSAMFCFDIDGKCIFANKKAAELFHIKGKGNYGVLEQYHKNWINSIPNGPRDYEQWEDVYDFNGQERHYYQEYQRFYDKKKKEAIGCFFKLEDRTDEIMKIREEKYRASHDLLTDLFNREYFFKEAEQFIHEHKTETIYMVCSNIKDFKLVNELFGTETGDKVLKRQADIIREMSSEDTISGRISGDKFAMLVRKSHFREGIFKEGIAKLQELTEKNNYKIHLNIGVYEIEDKDEVVQNMYDKANMAIETIRSDYGKEISYYDKKVMEQLIHEKNVVAEFEHAIEDKQFRMFLQPQMGRDGKLTGAEALVRWRHPQKGLVYPSEFIEVVEKAGLVHRLDRFIWEQAARRLALWKKRGLEHLSISVNISAKDFYQLDIYKIFTGLVEKYKINQKNLKLEITETALMKDLDRNLKILEKLQAYGFYIEIDDFGSGYSSLNMLKDIKADILKIDMVFLEETKNQKRSKTILNSIISMSKALGMPVITEGVETKEQFDFLVEMGSDIFQGFFFSKPMAVKAFEKKYFMEAE